MKETLKEVGQILKADLEDLGGDKAYSKGGIKEGGTEYESGLNLWYKFCTLWAVVKLRN
jgi:hypothetical protein